LNPCCELEVEKPTQALKSAKGPDNTFDLSLKWANTLPSLIYCPISTLIFELSFVEGGLYEYPMKNILRKSKFLPTWDLNQRYCPGL
jgi:hypothetical protein